jgi:hypothetical protein
MLLEQAPQRIVYPVLADVLAHRIQREGTLARAGERVGGPKQWRRRAGAWRTKSFPHGEQVAAQMLGPERLLDDPPGGVCYQTYV